MQALNVQLVLKTTKGTLPS